MINHLNKAKKVRDDEFYTLYNDIVRDIEPIKEQLKGKVIYCNADGKESNFIKYFKDNFKELGLKELIHSSDCFTANHDKLKRADIVITNPPFSLFRDYIDLLIKYEKKFYVMGSFIGVTHVNIFNYYLEDKIRVTGKHQSMNFLKPNGELKPVAVNWYTNLKLKENRPKLILTKEYNEKDYPLYDDKSGININKIKDIPNNYYGVMGVPVTILEQHNKEQFRIININHSPMINGKRKFKRIMIERIKNDKD